MKYACFQCLRGKHSSEAQHNKDLGDILRSTYKNQWCTPRRAITLPVLLPWDMWKVREDGLLTLLANRKHESHLLLLIVHLLGKNDSSTWGPPLPWVISGNTCSMFVLSEMMSYSFLQTSLNFCPATVAQYPPCFPYFLWFFLLLHWLRYHVFVLV